MLASPPPAVPVWGDMPNRVPGPDPVAPKPEPRPPVPAESELWTRTPAQLAAPGRRRTGADVWNTLVLLVAGGLGGFFGGVLYEKSYGPGAAPGASTPLPAVAAATPAPVVPDPPLPPSPPVGAAASAARVQTIGTLQPDVGDVLKYAREFRRVATLPVTDGSTFPSEGQFSRLLERFDWRLPGSPNFRRTPLLVVLGYANEQAASQRSADQLAQALAQSGITSPIYTCGMGSGQATPEVEKTGVGPDGGFVEVWVAFTLF